MKIFNKAFFSSPFTAVLCLCVCGLLFTGCGLLSKMNRTTQKIYWNFTSPDSELKKKVWIASFTNNTVYKNQDLEKLFVDTLSSRLKKKCGCIVLADPAVMPKFDPAETDPLKIAQMEQSFGLNAIITGKLSYIKTEKRKRGIWFFKKDKGFVTLYIDICGYDPETGAKMLDDTESYEFKVSMADYETIISGNETHIDPLDEAFLHITSTLAAKTCDALYREPWKGFIKTINGETVTLSAGEVSGLKPGDILTVYGRGEIVTGYNSRQFIKPGLATGKIQITSVFADHAEASVISGKIDGPESCVRKEE